MLPMRLSSSIAGPTRCWPRRPPGSLRTTSPEPGSARKPSTPCSASPCNRFPGWAAADWRQGHFRPIPRRFLWISLVIHRRPMPPAYAFPASHAGDMEQTLTAGDESPQNPQNPQNSQAPPAAQASPVPVPVDSPASLLALVPHLLGFIPEASFVVIGIDPAGHVKVTLRYDLPDPPGIGVAADVATHAVGIIGSQGITTTAAVGYGPETLVDMVAAAVRDAAGEAGIDLQEFLRVENGRYWSYVCGDEECCPAAGVPFDASADSASTAMDHAADEVLPGRAADPGTTMAAASVPEISRDWRLVALIGCVCFPASFALFHYVVPLGAWVAAAPELLVSAFCAGLTTVLAMLLAGISIARRMQVDNKRMRVAINNMSQGLCMFDRHERLVVCNRRYMDLYQLPDEVVQPGRTLARLLEFRIANGSFSRDPDEYRHGLVADMALGQTTPAEVKCARVTAGGALKH